MNKRPVPELLHLELPPIMGRTFEYHGLFALPPLNATENSSGHSTAIHLIRTTHLGSPGNQERRFLAEYEVATQVYSWAVGELSRQRGALSCEEYDKLGVIVEDVRSQSERARLALAAFNNSRTQT
jgi:hypothetical protein